MESLVDIIVPVHNKLVFVDYCLERLMASDAKDQGIIFVDNGSSEETREYLEAISMRLKNVSHIRFNENLGYAKACNLGIKSSSREYFVILHNDCFVSKEWLFPMLKLLQESTEEFAGVNPKCSYCDFYEAANVQDIKDKFVHVKPNNKKKMIRENVDEVMSHVYPLGLDNFAKSYGSGDQHETWLAQEFIPMEKLNSYCTLFRRSIFEKVGLFDESCYPKGLEEWDWSIRANRIGCDFFLAQWVFVHHWGNITSDGIGFDVGEQRKKANFLKDKKERLFYGRL